MSQFMLFDSINRGRHTCWFLTPNSNW